LAIWLLALLLPITCVLSTQMGHVSSFKISEFQDLSNVIRTFQSNGFWPLQSHFEDLEVHWDSLPKWELTWECGGSFPHPFPHSREHEMWLSGFTLTLNFANPCLGHEPKAKVVTNEFLCLKMFLCMYCLQHYMCVCKLYLMALKVMRT